MLFNVLSIISVLGGLCSLQHDLVVFHLIQIKAVNMRKLSYVLRIESKNHFPTQSPGPIEHRPETAMTSAAFGPLCD